ncbi:MAG: endonuclease domain-containing protein [Bauldia sp.]|nr:endonuclease domain-containing protein [Bauldia sp.]MCW5717511.1 endonuclease domain-containing protein [Bauldia sp.]
MPHSNIPTRTRRQATRLRHAMTEPERRLWRALRYRVPVAEGHWRKQVPIGRYIADFAHLKAKLVIEVDGSGHSESKRDPIRDAWLESEGFRVIRLWNTEIFTNLDGCLETIYAAVEARLAASDRRPPIAVTGNAT